MNCLDEEFRIALERIDADSWEELCRAAPEDVAHKLQMNVGRRDNVVVSRCLVADGPLGNRAIGIGLGQPCTRETIEQLVREFRGYGLKNFALQISPFAVPSGLTRWLPEAGLEVRSRWVKMVRGNAPAKRPRSGFEIKRIGPSAAALFGDVSARGFGRPPIIGHWMSSTVGFPRWRHYIAFYKAQPAAAAAMYIDGKYAWLGIGSTLPEFRARGAQTALIQERLLDGLALGARYFISETEGFNTSNDNLRRAGFERVYERPNYGIPVESKASD